MPQDPDFMTKSLPPPRLQPTGNAAVDELRALIFQVYEVARLEGTGRAQPVETFAEYGIAKATMERLFELGLVASDLDRLHYEATAAALRFAINGRISDLPGVFQTRVQAQLQIAGAGPAR